MSFSVPYKVLARGFTISGDIRSGYQAIVPYLVLWSHAFTFADELLGVTTATHVGPITLHLPALFPATAARLYARAFTMEPAGADGETSIPNQGLHPGEFFTHAIIRADYGTPPYLMQSGDDPNNLNQLDPDNPLTMCQQQVRSSGKMETRKYGAYIYDDDEKVVPGDFATPTAENKLILTFPRVPYLPWVMVRPYLNCVNLYPMLGVGKGELLLEDMDTRVEPAPGGQMQQSLQLCFAVSPEPGIEWNMVPKPSGRPYLVRRRSDAGLTDPRRIYAYRDFAEIFNQIQFSEG